MQVVVVVMKACLVVAGVVVVEKEAYSVVVYLVFVGAFLPAAAGEAFHEDACFAAVEAYLAGSYCVVAYPG